jgi:type IV pilus assembly protein PilV
MNIDRSQTGVGMLEFLVALLIFSMGMMGILSAQLLGKKTTFEAGQRSTATALARDILERMRANPGYVKDYEVVGLGDEANRLPNPDTDCDVTVCSAEELAVFDVWQWEAQLMGTSEQDSTGNAGGLFAPRACIASDGAAVDVTISWRGVTGVDVETTVDCTDVGEESNNGQGDAEPRHQLIVSTFIAGR